MVIEIEIEIHFFAIRRGTREKKRIISRVSNDITKYTYTFTKVRNGTGGSGDQRPRPKGYSYFESRF